MIRTKEWKLNAYGSQVGELHDMVNDPDEFHNLIADPQHVGTAEVLFERLEAWAQANAPDLLAEP